MHKINESNKPEMILVGKADVQEAIDFTALVELQQSGKKNEDTLRPSATDGVGAGRLEHLTHKLSSLMDTADLDTLFLLLFCLN